MAQVSSWWQSSPEQQVEVELLLDKPTSNCVLLDFQELTSICNPIVRKPKPKVELPKEEQKPPEPNGPVDGQGEINTAAPTTEQSAAAPPAAEKKLPEMDID